MEAQISPQPLLREVSMSEPPDPFASLDVPRETAQMRDEFTGLFPLLPPLEAAGFKKHPLYQATENVLNYRSATAELEVHSARTTLLTGYANEMLKDKRRNEEARVIIMNKGLDPQAFVLPDGTIFLNQALINRLDTLDEVVGVVAHEVNHILNSTYKQKTGNDLVDLGVGWVHEMAADVSTQGLLENLGFNSTALGSAIKKLTYGQRGSIHQTGLMRTAEVAASHMVLHSHTSHIPQRPLPPDWKQSGVRPLNREVLHVALDQKPVSLEQINLISAKLHPADFHELTRLRIGEDVREAVVEPEILRRLKYHGYSEEDIFTYQLFSGRADKSSYHPVPTSEQFVPFTTALYGEKKERFEEMYQKLFLTGGSENPTIPFLSYLSDDLYIDTPENRETTTIGAAVTEDTLLEGLEVIHKNRGKDYLYRYDDHRTNVLLTYINRAYIEPAAKEGRVIDTEAIKTFLTRASEKNVGVSFVSIRQSESLVALEEACKIVNSLGLEIKPEEAEKKDLPALLNTLEDVIRNPEQETTLDTALENVRTFFSEGQAYDTPRAKAAEEMFSRIDTIPFKAKTSLMEFFSGDKTRRDIDNLFRDEAQIPELTESEQQQNEQLARFHIKLTIATAFLNFDGDVFYGLVNNLMPESGIDVDSLSQATLLNLCSPLLTQHDKSTFKADYGEESASFTTYYLHGERPVGLTTRGTSIKNLEKLQRLPFLDAFLRKQDAHQFQDMDSLNKYTKKLQERTREFLRPFMYGDLFKHSLYSESMLSLLAFGKIRNDFHDIAAAGITNGQKRPFYEFVDDFLPLGPEKTRLLRLLSTEILLSEQKLQQKLTFLRDNFDTIGYEGLTLLAEQITTLGDYKALRSFMGEKLQEYLRINKRTTAAAGADVKSSEYTKHFESLIKTTLSGHEEAQDASTDFAKLWFQSFIESTYGRYAGVREYDMEGNAFYVDDTGKKTFQSIADAIESLRELSPSQRLAILVKSLFDKGGAFTSDENKAKFAALATESLGLGDGFIKEAITIAITQTNREEIIGVPLASVLAPRLFQNLSTEAIDQESLAVLPIKNKGLYARARDEGRPLSEMIPKANLPKLTTAPTHELVNFGFEFKQDPTSLGWKRAQEVKDQYYQTFSVLNDVAKTLERNGTAPPFETQGGNQTPTDAILKAIQASGTVGVRSLQLTTQVDLGLSQEQLETFSSCFDQNPGISKIFIWENLFKLSLGRFDKSNPYPRTAEFISDRLVDVRSILGRGSMYTTLAATVKDAKGQPHRAVIKMLNPNAIMTIQANHEIAADTFRTLIETGTPEEQTQAQIALDLVDFAKEWCLNDINDPSFMEDDVRFRDVIKGYNRQTKGQKFAAPEVLFNDFMIKSEEEASERTINSLVNDPKISDEVKQQAVQGVIGFFEYTLGQGKMKLVDHVTGGKRKYLLLSDPNPGNTMVDLSTGQMRMNVIDRSMFLSLTGLQVQSLQSLWHGQTEKFGREFIQSICHENKIRDPRKMLRIGESVQAKLKQRFSVAEMGEIDPLRMAQVAMSHLKEEGLEVPLHYRIALKNVFTMQTLRRRFAAPTLD